MTIDELDVLVNTLPPTLQVYYSYNKQTGLRSYFNKDQVVTFIAYSYSAEPSYEWRVRADFEINIAAIKRIDFINIMWNNIIYSIIDEYRLRNEYKNADL